MVQSGRNSSLPANRVGTGGRPKSARALVSARRRCGVRRPGSSLLCARLAALRARFRLARPPRPRRKSAPRDPRCAAAVGEPRVRIAADPARADAAVSESDRDAGDRIGRDHRRAGRLRRAERGGPFVRGLGVLYLIGSPVFVYLATRDYASLLLGALLAAATYGALRFLEDRYSLPLFLAGTILGSAFFIEYRCLLLLPVFAGGVALSALRRSRSEALGLMLTITLPSLFFALSWMYINWIFLGDPLLFVRVQEKVFASRAPLVVDPLTIGRGLLIALPYVAGLGCAAAGEKRWSLSRLCVYLVPLWFAAIELVTRGARPEFGLLAPLILTSLMAARSLRDAVPMRLALLAGFAASFLGTPAAPPGVANIGDFRALANVLAGHPGGPVLLDDGIFYPVVAFSSDTRRFILPYQARFRAAIEAPGSFARYVVVAPNDPNDQVAAAHPSVARGVLNGFELLDSVGPYRVFRAREAGPYHSPETSQRWTFRESWEAVRLPVTVVLAILVLAVASYAWRRLAVRPL